MTKGSPHDLSDGTKPCPRCEQRKPISEFGKNSRTYHGIATYCKACTNAMQIERRQTPEGAQKHRDGSKKWRDANVTRHADNNARWKYGVAHGTYDAMFQTQSGKCAICNTTTPGGNSVRFHIDHCHGSKAIRGLLCTNCNNGLGRFNDDPDRLRKAAAYLEMFLPEGGREGAK